MQRFREYVYLPKSVLVPHKVKATLARAQEHEAKRPAYRSARSRLTGVF